MGGNLDSDEEDEDYMPTQKELIQDEKDTLKMLKNKRKKRKLNTGEELTAD